MLRLVWFSLASMLAFAGGNVLVHAADTRIDPDAAQRGDIHFTLDGNGFKVAAADRIGAAAEGLPTEYGSAMNWYRTALADGYTQPPLVASPWLRDEQLPEPLQWTWVSDSGDIITRAGKGVFRLSFANNRSNWFHDVDCRLMAWPGGDSETSMTCGDGLQRVMRIPGDGVVLVDDVQYERVFDSDATTLPPEEVIDVEELTAAIMEGAGLSPSDAAAAAEKPAASRTANPVLPEQGPIPQLLR